MGDVSFVEYQAESDKSVSEYGFFWIISILKIRSLYPHTMHTFFFCRI